MTLTRSFTSVVDARIAREPDFRDALLRESIDTMLAGGVETGKAILRRYIEATVGFAALGDGVGAPSQTLEGMFQPNSHSDAASLFRVLDHLQTLAGSRFHVAT